jgi:hypothetical protein
MDSHHIHTREFKGSTKATSELQTDSVNKCLTDDCKDCTGSYSNNVLYHRLICLCVCHRKSKKASLEVVDSKILQQGHPANKGGDDL